MLLTLFKTYYNTNSNSHCYHNIICVIITSLSHLHFELIYIPINIYIYFRINKKNET